MDVVVVIPALDEAERIADLVRVTRSLDGVAAVIVVDDGSTDRTNAIAVREGAEVVRHPRNHGKGDALMSGLGRVAGLKRVGRLPEHVAVLLVDADLTPTHDDLRAVVDPVLAAKVDLAIGIARVPTVATSTGQSLLAGLGRKGIEELTGFTAAEPMSGLRCLSAAAIDAATPFARGFGVEVGMTIDVLDAGLTVAEVPCDLRRLASGTDWRSQRHRASQARDVALAVAVRRLRRRLGPG